MRVVLEVREGKAAGRKIWLLSGQTIHVGRNDASDFVIPEDPRLSSRHFQVECQWDVCRLRDLNSTNGTLINGGKVHEHELRDGDEIVAGQTRFGVTIVADAADAAASVPRTMSASPATLDRNSATSDAASGESLPSATSRATQLPVLVLDAESTGAVRRRIWLRPERAVTFGRSRQADEAFPHDQGMSGQHFVMEPTGLGWRCRDVGSTNGTFLNDAPIVEVIIHPGDRIAAGSTVFVVDMPHGAADASLATLKNAEENTDRPVARQVMRPPKPSELMYRAFCGRSGLVLYLGQKGSFDPAIVARTLAKSKSPLVISDRSLADAVCPTASRSPLFGPEETTDQALSRVIVGPASTDEWCALITAAWGQNSLVVTFPSSNDQSALEALRAFSRASSARGGLASPLTDLRPLALVEFLANSSPSDITGLFPVLHTIYVEAHQGDRWAILAPADREPDLRQNGFRAAAAWE